MPPNAFGFVTFHEPVPNREASHAAIPYGADPVEGCDEEPVHYAPHAAHAVGKCEAGGVHGIGRTRAGPEGGERLEEFSETPPAHEIVFLPFDPPHGPKADAGHAREVDEENKIVDGVHYGD